MSLVQSRMKQSKRRLQGFPRKAVPHEKFPPDAPRFLQRAFNALRLAPAVLDCKMSSTHLTAQILRVIASSATMPTAIYQAITVLPSVTKFPSI